MDQHGFAGFEMTALEHVDPDGKEGFRQRGASVRLSPAGTGNALLSCTVQYSA
ncbi:hypothetical protein ABMB44_13095 [Levilactobacillus brevis]